VNVDVARTPPLTELPSLQAALRAAEQELAGQGRVLVRYSGTQPVCRVMVEGPTEQMIDRLSEALAQAVRDAIGYGEDNRAVAP
jgi:phosphoglucosamine mutase